MKIIKALVVAAAALFIAGSAFAQNVGTVTSHAFAVGKGAGKQGLTSILCASAQIPLGQSAADPICRTLSGDVTIDSSGVTAIGANKVTVGMMATLAADKLIGNPTGSTATPQAFSLVNCANSLTYSTSTHSFGCNVSAGTGTVTSVATAGLATGGPITATGTVTVTAATKSDMQTATSTTTAVTPAQVQNHPAVGKVVVGFNGLNASCPAGACVSYHNFGVTSIARNSTGDYTVTFSTACTTATYAWFISASTPGTTIGGFFAITTIATGSLRFTTRDTANTLTDFSFVNLEVACTQ